MELSLFPDEIERYVVLEDASGSIVLHRGFDQNENPLEESVLSSFQLKQESIRLFGKEVLQPRLSALFGDTGIYYTYSQKKFEALSWNPFLRSLVDKLQHQGYAMNSALVNYYRDGSDSMGLHADNEPELGKNPTILSVNYGASRKMVFRKNTTKDKLEVTLNHGDLLIMSGALQHEWKHELPKQKKVSQPRLNITFRKIYDRSTL